MIPTEYINELKKLVHNEYHGKLLACCISGSHLYGTNSSDSDIDFRGFYVYDTNSLLGLTAHTDNIVRTINDNDIELFELKKELGLLYNGNCNKVETLFAKQLWTSDEYFELKKLTALNLNMTGIYQSYRGMAWQNYNKFCLAGKHTVKKFLYVYRSLLAGIHAINTRTIEPNLKILNKEFNITSIDELIELKNKGLENDPLEDQIGAKHHKQIEYLFTVLDGDWEKVRPDEKLRTELDKTRFKYFDKYLKKIRRQYYQ